MNVLRLCFGVLFLADTPKSAKIKIIETSYFSYPQAYFLRIEKREKECSNHYVHKRKVIKIELEARL